MRLRAAQPGGLPDALLSLVTLWSIAPIAVIGVVPRVDIALGRVFESLSMLLRTVPASSSWY